MTACASPALALDGFSGPLDELLTLARAQRIDLARLSLPDLLDQLMAALQLAGPLNEKAEWVVTAAWLVQIRSRLLLPADDPDVDDAAAEAERLRAQLMELEAAQALAGWLDRRPVLGRDTFPRGQPEFVGVSAAETHQIDVVEFLWSAMALFDDDLGVLANTERYRPPARPELYSVAEARVRILEQLTLNEEGMPIDRLLPSDLARPAGHEINASPPYMLRRRSAWTSTFTACLEMAKQSEIKLEQADFHAAVYVTA